ncbi:helix-turn-helix domain-containing protein [Oceanibacterium hippocampi]|uniref:Helix-turn-helix domain protein n=1 Tax=Oceanibacterium hippocampi TaxID=745714 RepID=A0A1Y5U0A4_9PROT|nr:helix-turn-helix domain-containing protein [Oceanibacterium hippocampi]SLN77280.1 hypothetical protein OCH7691_04370 [Oceanibacterium hippocampi]
MSLRAISYVFDHSLAEGKARLVLLALADYADENWIAYPSVKRLAAKTRISERGIFRFLGDLQKAGELEKAGVGRRGVVRYRIIKRDGTEEEDAPPSYRERLRRARTPASSGRGETAATPATSGRGEDATPASSGTPPLPVVADKPSKNLKTKKRARGGERRSADQIMQDWWRDKLEDFRDDGVWPERERIGPSPAESGCRAPPQLIEEILGPGRDDGGPGTEGEAAMPASEPVPAVNVASGEAEEIGQ